MVKAPGTFGYDPTKYRKRYSAANPEQIPMDEFGQKPLSPQGTLQIPSPVEHSSQPSSPMPTTPRSFDGRRAESPPPFSHYGRQQDGSPAPPQVMQPLAPLPPAHNELLPPGDEGGPGCCKCVIM